MSNNSNNFEDKDNRDLLESEFDDYRKSLIFIKECPACHYAQAMVLLGIAFFSTVRMQFLWKSLNWKQILGYSSLSLVFGSLGMYKMSYAYHIFTLQGRVKKMKENKKI